MVPLAPAPDPFARDTTYVPSDLLAVLDGQLDLDSVTVNPGVRVYENAAYGPSRALLPAGTALPAGWRGPHRPDRPRPRPRPRRCSPTSRATPTGPAPSTRRASCSCSAAGDGWTLEVDGTDVPSAEALGWANSFPVEQAGAATLRFDTPVTRWLALAGQVLLWVIAFGYLLRVRVREDESTELQPAGPAPHPRPPPTW